MNNNNLPAREYRKESVYEIDCCRCGAIFEAVWNEPIVECPRCGHKYTFEVDYAHPA
jgi:DNA-directed RNA polymerase subunit RPC12/RpoP